ncbi:MAG: ATP-binding protein, partial [Nanoarchaeota archaeon]
ESKARGTIKKYNLFKKKEKIIIALSGGKDSATTAYLLKKLGYDPEGIHIDLKIGSYSEKCLNAVKQLCNDLDIKLHVYDTKKELGSGMCYLRTSVQEKNLNSKKGKLKNCAVCGVIKKWILNKKARELKADKIATGHNLDDEAQTFLMNIFKGSPELSFNTGPISRNISDKMFVPRIKPLFFIAEEDVRKFSKEKNLPVVYDKCPCATDSYRIQIRKIMESFSEKEKLNIIRNFDILKSKIPKTKDTKVSYCKICGEPARNNLCRMCKLVRV